MDFAKIILELYAIQAIKFGSFTLKSGIQSPIYLDLRLVISYPDLLNSISEALWEKIKDLPRDLICGVPYTALPFACAISLKHRLPMLMVRKEGKLHGTKKMVEGVFKPDQTCLVIDDLVTSGTSILETTAHLHHEGIKVRDVAVVVDREHGGREKLEEKGYFVHSLFGMSDLLQILLQAKKIDQQVYETVSKFIQDSRSSKLE